ncbi:hypothetical protein JCM10207_007893 [Rhodosporidiobolus poonsookiae]
MGLFSRKKTRESPLPPPPPAPSGGRTRSAPVTTTLASPPEPSSSIASPAESSTSTWSRTPKPSSHVSPPSTSSRFANAFRPSGAVSRSSVPLVPGASVRETNSSQGSWDDAGVPLGERGGGAAENSPNLAPLDRYKLFGGGRASSSTVSLPLLNSTREETTPRMRQTSAMAPVDEHEPPQDKGVWGRWKAGRGAKQRQGSVSSFRMFDGAGLGIGGAPDSEESGFVVKSFRSVSRVHEDPVAREGATSPSSHPLPALPGSAPPIEPFDPSQQESLRTSIDYSASPSSRSGYPRRPSLNTYGAAPPPDSRAWERAPSPTITAEAFRLASARSKSSISLVSISRDDDSPLAEPSRPRFEPQRPSSRTSRRGSSYSDAGSPSILQPPRPSFAVGQRSNSSKSSMHSRASSSGSVASYMLGQNGLPQPSPPSMTQEPLDAGRGAVGMGMANSQSIASVASYRTAPSTPSGPSRVASPTQHEHQQQPSLSLSTSTSRPEMAKRMSSGDSELRFIAQYADSILGSPPCDSPVDLPFVPGEAGPSRPKPRFSFSDTAAAPAPSSSASTPRKPAQRQSSAPAVAVQPPTPVANPGFSSSATIASVPRRTSSLAPDAVKSALHTMGVGPGAALSSAKPAPSKKKVLASARGWADSSDEEEEERLSTSSEEEGNSDSDDEVPLAQIQSRSQTDLTLRNASRTSLALRPDEMEQVRLAASAGRKGSDAVEVLADPNSPTSSGFALATAPAPAAGADAGLVRRGSNRRSMSTFSLSTSVTSAQLSVLASSAPGSSAAPAASPPSILRPTFQPRSVSNPSTPSMPYFAQLPPSSGAGTPALSPAPSPTFPAAPRDRSSSSSGSASGTGSTSSTPVTPHDLSPSVSDLGVKLLGGKPSVKFDSASLASNAHAQRSNRGRRLSAMSNTSASVLQPPPPLNLGGVQQHRSTPSLPTFASPAPATPTSARTSPARPSFLGPNQASGAVSSRPGSTLTPGTTPAHSRAASTVTGGASTPASSTSGGGKDDVYERMKARHRAEALQALKIGRDLNNPSGLVPDEEDEEDDDEPLASLPTRAGGAGSMIGGMSGVGMPGMGMPPMGIQGMGMGVPMGMGMGGAYSPLAVAPPGVDPYLYASLPPDQKMSLHQRAQQMMAMMQQAALQARAESVIGSTMGGDGGSMLNGGGGGAGGPGHLRGSMSMGGLDMMAMQQQQQQQQMAMGMGGLGHQHSPSMQFNPAMAGADPYGTFPRGARLPPFAPPFAMSQPFFQGSPSMYGMPAYAGSAIGFGGGPGSMMGGPTGAPGRAGGKAASTIGVPRR